MLSLPLPHCCTPKQTNKPTNQHALTPNGIRCRFWLETVFDAAKVRYVQFPLRLPMQAEKHNSSHKFPKTQNRMMINTNMNRVQDNQDIVGGGRWTPEEHMLFIEGFKMFGKDWKRISKVVETRNNIQCRTHAQKFFRSHPQELALLLAIKKQNAQSPVVNEPLIKPAFIPYQQQSFPLQQQQHLPVLDARFVAYVKQRVNQVPGPLFMPFM